MFVRALLTVGTVLVVAAPVLAQASFTGAGYSESFDSMGSGGTASPTGWKHLNQASNFGTNATWTTTIPASGAISVATIPVTQAGTTLSAITTPAATNNNGFNAAASAVLTSDRVIATSPTSIAGNFIQLALSNDTGVGMVPGSVLTIGFDTIRYTSVATANELPGYWLFASMDGTSWINVETILSPNPTILSVPNTAGTTSRSVDFTLPSSWAAGSAIYFRWVDDNAVATSPDQIIGLNNVSIIPTPGAAVLIILGIVSTGRRRR